MSEEKNFINKQKGKEILDSLFKISKSDQNKYYPIIEDSTNISNLLYFLKDTKNNILDKARILMILLQLFKENDFLIPLFIRKNKSTKINIYEPLIDLYFCNDNYINEIKELIEQLIKLICKNITLTKAPIEYLCQKLSNYFENKNNKIMERLNENEILKYLKLFQIFYVGGGSNEKNILEKISFNLTDNINTNVPVNSKEIKNYIYFNGKRSYISLALNQNSINPNTDYPTLQYGLSFIMWVYIDEKLIKNYQENNGKEEIKLVVINISGEQIKLVLKDIYTFQVSLNDSEIKNINSSLMSVNDWNNICFSILEKKDTKLSFKIYINSGAHASFLSVPKNFPVSSKINTMKLFENFIGKVSSFMLITKGLEQKEANYFSNLKNNIKIEKNYGFYKNKLLFDFLLSNEKNYFSNCKNYKYYEEFKSNKEINFYDLNLNKQNIKNMMGIFCPFAYNKEENQIDDIFGNFIGFLGENDGVNYYINNSKKIRQLGGINNLLPIMELMYSSISKSKRTNYNLVDKSILTQTTFYEYLNLVKNILVGHSQNLSNINNSKFFSSISLFIEKFPPHLFTPKILEILLVIGKETFQNVDKYNIKGENYISLILLNEKIISKYNVENQINLWKNIYSFFTSDDTQIKDSFNINKICLLLRLFDEERYCKYCCKKHAEVFKTTNIEENGDDMGIMEPEMNVRLDELFKIIQIYINKLGEEEESISLFQLLSLDLSPCLQKKIIQVYVNYFSNKKIELNTKLKCFDILIKNNFIELIEYVFNISLLDIRVDILSLFKTIYDYKEIKNKFKDYNESKNKGLNNFYAFITENLLPDQLYAEIDEKKEEEEEKNTILENLLIKNMGKKQRKELIPLTNYFNRRIYEKEVNNIWNMLLKWMLYKASPQSNSNKKKDKEYYNIHNFTLDFCISFASKSPFNFIDLFMISLISYFKDESILNREIFYLNKNLYYWLIETIYIFHNSELDNLMFKKEDILSIQKNSMILFEEFFIHRRPHEEINKRIYYIQKYSIHLKKIYGLTNNRKIREITRITRLLLQKIMDVSSLHMNYKTKSCFEFIVFHKCFDQLTGMKKNITNTNLMRVTMNPKLKKSITKENIGESHNSINTFNRINMDNNLILDKIEENPSEKRIDDFHRRKSINSINLEEPNSSNSEGVNNNNSLLNKTEIIPAYIFNSLHCHNPLDNNQEKGKDNKGRNLKIIWEDFSLYDNIIDYYSSNIWGTENLSKKVNLDIDGNIMILCKKLLKEYGENKSYRNILLKDILKCFNIKYSEDSQKAEKVKINLLNINIILLSIALELTQDYDESVFLEGKFQQFVIYCVIASININPNDIYYDLIQDNLSDVLGFAFIFLKKKDKTNYNKLVDNLVIPILGMDEVKKFKFFKSKKNTNKNSAIYRLFEFREKKKEDPEELDDFNNNNIDYAISRNTMNFNFKRNTDKDIISKKGVNYVDDSNINKKNNNNLKVVFKGENDIILKHLFEDYLTKIKEENNYNFGFKTNYNKLFSNNVYITGNNPTLEKSNINKIVKKIVHLYETQIKNYANNEYLQEKIRKNIYKTNKSRLFSWKGFWSNKYLFYNHPELLKLKIKNHYTKEMIKPLLVPILDIEYYTPPFKKFDKTKLFNTNNYNYKINLDIDDILINETDENLEKIKKENKNLDEIKTDNEDFVKIKNKNGFNYLECLYKLTYTDLWDKYKTFAKEKIIFEKLISLNKESYSMLINSKKMSKNIENIQRENIYNCCIVKLTHHIKGYISTEKSRIRFIYESDSDIKEEELEKDPNYDKEMQCCFGSIFKNKKNDKDKIIISIDYINIKYIFIRQYFYIESALEIFTDNNKSYFLNFKTNKDLDQFKRDILHHWTFREIKAEDYKNKKIIGYQRINPNLKKKNYHVINKMEEWQNNNISTLEYLMWLNIFSGRSFNDLTQYPVFPWIITNYTDEAKEISIKDDLRNLSIPMGMIDLSEKGVLRKETFIETYDSIKNDLKEMFPDFNYQDYLKKGDEYLENYKIKTLKKEKENIEFNQIPYFYGSHYSNPTYVSHFLARIFPYSYISIEIQGEKFDDPDRIFISMQKTFESASSLKDDVRELIPEFYTLPETFLNKNNLNLSQNKIDSENNLIVINDVKLPIWCNNNAFNFVIKMRRYLESNYINNNLNKWIDLIFGVTQRGEKAEENHNIFQAHTYDKNVKIDSVKDIDSRNALMRQYEMGVTPFQIFESESKIKTKNNSNNIITLDESKKLTFKTIKSNRFNALKNKKYENNKLSNDPSYKEENLNISHLKIVKISCMENEKIKIFTNENQWYVIKIVEDEIYSNNDILKIEESNYYKFQNNSNKYACSYFISNIETPIIVFNDNQKILKSGFWDGRLELNNLNLETKEDPCILVQTYFNPDYSPIITMEISKSEKIILCGTKDGVLLSYKINGKTIEYKKSLYLFDDEILSISINENLNMFAVSSKDGFVNIHILPSFNLVRSISLNVNEKEDKDEKENNSILYADNIFLSSSPLACITLYITSKRLFKSYTINGEFICEVKESDESYKIKSPIVYTNNNFQDILIYGTNDGFIKIRKFPDMILINSIEIFPGNEINCICITQDKRFCYACSSDNIIALIKDSDIKDINNNLDEFL